MRRKKASRDEWECVACGGTCHACTARNGRCRNMARGGVYGKAKLSCERCSLGKAECSRITEQVAALSRLFSPATVWAAARRHGPAVLVRGRKR